jgi:hypothetical protein
MNMQTPVAGLQKAVGFIIVTLGNGCRGAYQSIRDLIILSTTLEECDRYPLTAAVAFEEQLKLVSNGSVLARSKSNYSKTSFRFFLFLYRWQRL